MKEEKELQKKEEKQTHRILKKIIITLILLGILLFAYARYFIHQMISIEEYPVIIEDLPSNFNGLKITQFSDIHFGRTINEQEVEKIVEQINLTNADIVIFTGDLLDNSITLSDKNVDDLKKSLKKIDARLKKIAIKGDSDYLNIEKYEEIMTSAGFQILENQNILLFDNGEIPIEICGISSIVKENYDLKKCYETKETKIGLKILLAHEPIILDKLGEQKVDLILAGHSLGGLIRFPYIGNIFKKDNTGKYQKGQYQKDSTQMYVSSGLGTENYPIRFLNNPTINLYRLYNY